MNKSTTQLIADIRHSCSILEAINNGPTGNRKHENIEALKSDNLSLKKKITSLNKSNGQFKSLFRKQNKKSNRFQSENEALKTTIDVLSAENNNLKKLVNSLQDEIKLIESNYESVVEQLTNRGIIPIIEYPSDSPTKILITEDETTK